MKNWAHWPWPPPGGVHLLIWICKWNMDGWEGIGRAAINATLDIFRFIELGTRKPDTIANLIPLQLSFPQQAFEELGQCNGWISYDGNFLQISCSYKSWLWPACESSKDLTLAFHHRMSLWQMQIMFCDNWDQGFTFKCLLGGLNFSRGQAHKSILVGNMKENGHHTYQHLRVWTSWVEMNLY